MQYRSLEGLVVDLDLGCALAFGPLQEVELDVSAHLVVVFAVLSHHFLADSVLLVTELPASLREGSLSLGLQLGEELTKLDDGLCDLGNAFNHIFVRLVARLLELEVAPVKGIGRCVGDGTTLLGLEHAGLQVEC